MDSPRGRIQLMAGLESGRLNLTDEVRRHLDLCLGCRACEPACPSGVPYGSLIEAARPYVEARRSFVARTGHAFLVWTLASKVGTLPLRVARRLPGLPWLARRLPGMGAAYVASLPPPRRASPLPAVLEPDGVPRGTAVLLAGCVSESLFPDTNRAAALLLRKAGVRVVIVRGRCCGALFAHAGLGERARVLGEQLVRDLPAGVDWVVTTAAGCGAHLQGLGHVVHGGVRAVEIAGRARDALSLLASLGLPAPTRPFDVAVAVHDPCHLAHGQGVRDEVRTLLASIPGVRFVPLAESDVCCGSAGTYNLTERAMARRLLERKLRNIEASGARIVVAANPGCLMQIRAGAMKWGGVVEVEHPLDVLVRAHGLV
jgi:glycolate oxidase iron-sulfur subunit